VEQACNGDIDYVDLARGDETYKRSFKNEYLEVAEGSVRQPSLRATVDRAVRTPARAARAYILERPRVRNFVRNSLRRFGEIRVGERA
jgi:CelD/BcsL family acetyltransferase involved in cellulose biosynthesis